MHRAVEPGEPDQVEDVGLPVLRTAIAREIVEPLLDALGRDFVGLFAGHHHLLDTDENSFEHTHVNASIMLPCSTVESRARLVTPPTNPDHSRAPPSPRRMSG